MSTTLKESPQAQHAYSVYESMPDRSYAKLALALNRPPSYKRTIEYWATQYDWQARVVAYDLAQRELARTRRDADEAIRHQRKLTRELHREDLRAQMDDERAEIFGKQWAKTLLAINEMINAKRYRGMVGLVALLKLSLDEQRLALGGATQIMQINDTSAATITSAAGIAMAQEILARIDGDTELRDAVALALLAEASVDATSDPR